jgi:group I intron endonuclease
MEKMYEVYLLTFPDGKKYFGCSSNAQKRWGCGKKYIHNDRMMEAIMFHGWKNIKHEILHRNLSKEEALKIESSLIIEHETFKPEIGFNVSKGSVDGVPYHSAEGIERIRAATTGRMHTEEAKKKMSEAKKGTAFHTKKHTEETKALISENRKGKTAKENHPMARPVMCVETGIIYPYAKAAEEATGIGRAHICQVCKGQRKTAGKLHWEYAEKEAK